MPMWYNSDCFDFTSALMLWSNWDLRDHICCLCTVMAILCWVSWLHYSHSENHWWDSDATVMVQWCNCERESDDFEFTSCLMLWSKADVCNHICYLLCTEVEIQYWVGWLHSTNSKNQWRDSVKTVMKQWWDSDITVLALIAHPFLLFWCNRDVRYHICNLCIDKVSVIIIDNSAMSQQ
jgi:hypothetical protein